MFKFYIAGRWPRRGELLQYKQELEGLGFTCTSRWLDRKEEFSDKDASFQDIADIADADAIIHFTEDDPNIPRHLNTGGRHVEFGIVLGLQLIDETVISGDGSHRQHQFIIGPTENVFHSLACGHFATWQEFIDHVLVTNATLTRNATTSTH